MNEVKVDNILHYVRDRRCLCIYKTKSDIAVLHKLGNDTWGFIYINRPCSTPKFVDRSIVRCVQRAINFTRTDQTHPEVLITDVKFELIKLPPYER